MFGQATETKSKEAENAQFNQLLGRLTADRADQACELREALKRTPANALQVLEFVFINIPGVLGSKSKWEVFAAAAKENQSEFEKLETKAHGTAMMSGLGEEYHAVRDAASEVAIDAAFKARGDPTSGATSSASLYAISEAMLLAECMIVLNKLSSSKEFLSAYSRFLSHWKTEAPNAEVQVDLRE